MICGLELEYYREFVMRHIFTFVLTIFLLVPAYAAAEEAPASMPSETPATTPAQPAEPAMPASTTEAPAAAETPALPAAPNDAVARAVFTSAIQDREPVDTVHTLSADHDKVFFFTELHGLAGHTITHRWIYQGQVKAEITFVVKGDRWRVWSSKRLVPSLTGTWQVDVVDQGGSVLNSATLNIMPVTENP